MEHRKMPKLGIETSLLGFGCMRFPMKNGKIDEPEAEKMLDKAILSGVNYIDTAYPYHGGDSEPFVGRVLDKYPRESYFLATKLPCWEVNSLDDAKRLFKSQLKRLNKDYVDFYLLHSLSGNSFRKMKELGVVEYCEALKAAGKIRYYGFSFHDGYEAFEEILNYRDWDFCQIQLNYMDVDIQAGIKGYELAKSKGIPVVVMEPVKGGSLANLPQEIKAALDGCTPGKSCSSWALRWVGSHDGVKVILSGMSNMEQVDDNLATFDKFIPLSEAEEKAVANAADMMRKRVNNGCTGCRYCMPCPAGVNIPANFRIWNGFGVYGSVNSTVWEWSNGIADGEKAKNCAECGQCEGLCPQHLPIREHLKRLQSELDALKYE